MPRDAKEAALCHRCVTVRVYDPDTPSVSWRSFELNPPVAYVVCRLVLRRSERKDNPAALGIAPSQDAELTAQQVWNALLLGQLDACMPKLAVDVIYHREPCSTLRDEAARNTHASNKRPECA